MTAIAEPGPRQPVSRWYIASVMLVFIQLAVLAPSLYIFNELANQVHDNTKGVQANALLIQQTQTAAANAYVHRDDFRSYQDWVSNSLRDLDRNKMDKHQ